MHHKLLTEKQNCMSGGFQKGEKCWKKQKTQRLREKFETSLIPRKVRAWINLSPRKGNKRTGNIYCGSKTFLKKKRTRQFLARAYREALRKTIRKNVSSFAGTYDVWVIGNNDSINESLRTLKLIRWTTYVTTPLGKNWAHLTWHLICNLETWKGSIKTQAT